MVDFFLVLLLAGGGDDLQGIKRGIIEIADMIAVTKADGDNIARAKKAAAIYQRRARHHHADVARLGAPVLTISAQDNRGLDDAVGKDLEHRERMTATGEFQARRGAQAVDWMHDLLQQRLLAALEADRGVAARMASWRTRCAPARARRRWRSPSCCRWSGSVLRCRLQVRHEHSTLLRRSNGTSVTRTRRCCSPRSGRSRCARQRHHAAGAGVGRERGARLPDVRFVTETLATEWQAAPRRSPP
jgi:hypothetical protein